MPRFKSGFVVGVFTGVMFHDTIMQAVRYLADVAEEKVSDLEEDLAEKADKAKASTRYPATGSGLGFDRITEINNSTPEEPVWVTDEEMNKMNTTYLRVALGAGRLKIVGYHDSDSEDES